MGDKKISENFIDELRIEGIDYKGFGIIPKLLMLDTDLTIEAKGIGAYFYSYAGSGNTAFPGRDKIVHDLGISKDTYYKHLSLLKEQGYLKVEKQHAHGGYGKGFDKNIYTLITNPKKLATQIEGSDILSYTGIKKGGFGTIAKAVMTDDRLSIKEKALYAYYCSFAGAGEVANPKKDDILYHLNVSHNSYNKYLSKLIELDFLIRVQRKTNGTFGVCDIYINSFPGKEFEIPEDSPCTKISDTQIKDKQTDIKGMPSTKFSDIQNPDSQFSDEQNQDAINNNKKINSFKNNQSYNQGAPAPDSDGVIENLLDFDFSLLEQGIPEEWLHNRKLISKAVKYLNDYDRLSDISEWGNDVKGELYKIYVNSLIDMLSTKKVMTLTGDSVTAEDVNELYRSFIQPCGEPEYIDTLMDYAVNSFIEGAKKTQVKNTLGYMKANIWTVLKQGDTSISAIIHDCPDMAKTVVIEKELSIKEKVKRNPEISSQLSFFIEDYRDYKERGSKRVFETEKKIKELLKENGIDEDALYKEILPGYELG